MLKLWATQALGTWFCERSCDKWHCHMAYCRNVLRILGYPLRSMSSNEISFPRNNLYGCFIADQTGPLVPGRHWEPARAQSVKKGPEETERRMGHRLGQHGCCKQSYSLEEEWIHCWRTGHESFISEDLQVCCLWVSLLRSSCFPVKRFMILAIKEMPKFSPSLKWPYIVVAPLTSVQPFLAFTDERQDNQP